MMSSLKKLFKWNSVKNLENKKNHTSLILAAFIGLLDDILYWKKMWLSLCCIFIINLFLFVCIYQKIKLLEFIFGFCATTLCVDAFEAWLKNRHRTSFLKKIASHNATDIKTAAEKMKYWIRRRWMEFVCLRDTNHTKAFLLVNIVLTIVFIIGKYISGYILIYLLCMFVCIANKLAPPILAFVKKIEQHAESDGELEGLIPEVSDVDIKLLSIEPEPQVGDDRQSLDYWKPEDLNNEDASDSSENSSSLVTNLSIEKLQTLEKDVEISDSSDDEYIPLETQNEQLKTTLEVAKAESTWSSTAYNAFYNLTGAVANMVYSSPQETKRKRISSIDSSDGFEIIDKTDIN